jgi:hypothetical protein
VVAAAIIGMAGVLGNGGTHGLAQDPATTHPQSLNGQPAPRFPPMSLAPRGVTLIRGVLMSSERLHLARDSGEPGTPVSTEIKDVCTQL